MANSTIYLCRKKEGNRNLKCTPNVRQKTNIWRCIFMSKYSYEQRLETVLNVVEKHMSIMEAARLLGSGYEHVRRWVKRYEAFGVEGLLLKNSSYDVNSF
jgi:transposase-like protein